MSVTGILLNCIIYCIGIVALIIDRVTQFFGFKLQPVNHQSILGSLPASVVAESKAPGFNAKFDNFIRAFSSDPNLGLIGRTASIWTARRVLEARHHIRKTFQDNPDIEHITVRRPVFMIGLCRTGSTFLHRLLAIDPQFFAPMFWEMKSMDSVGRDPNWRSSKRYKTGYLMASFVKYVGGLENTHEMSADMPEECTGFFLIATMYLLMMSHFPRVEDLRNGLYNWKHEESVETYTIFKKYIQINAYKDLERQSFLTRSPHHLPNLLAILEVFPDAQFIFTQRDISQTLASFCSLTATMWRYDLNRKESLCVADDLATMANKGVEILTSWSELPKAEKPPLAIVDYPDLTSDPIKAVKDIYKTLDRVLEPDIEARMREFLISDAKKRQGIKRHKYSMQDCGLNEEDLEKFAPYLTYMNNNIKRNLNSN